MIIIIVFFVIVGFRHENRNDPEQRRNCPTYSGNCGSNHRETRLRQRNYPHRHSHGGAFLAARLQKALVESGAPTPSLGILDITLYRDDWTKISSIPIVGKTELPFSIDDRLLILVDDVLYTGRTVRAAMDALMDYGRPKKIELAILADRGTDYRELPIAPDYKGGTWTTSAEETINVYLAEAGFEDHATIEKKKAA